MATIRKGDLALSISNKLTASGALGERGGTRAAADAALNAVLESITEAVAAGNRVVLTGFGSFESRQVKARQVTAIRGPQAGQRINVPAHKRVGFTAGADLAGAVRK